MPRTPTYPDLYSEIKASVKASVSRWPSAYASGQLVKRYKARVSETYGMNARPYVENKEATAPLTTWFREKWIDIKTGKPCGSVKTSTYYPTCRPLVYAQRMTPHQRQIAIKLKQQMKNKTVRSTR